MLLRKTTYDQQDTTEQLLKDTISLIWTSNHDYLQPIRNKTT